MKRYHVVMLPMRNVINTMRYELLKQAWQKMWQHVEKEREKMVSCFCSFQIFCFELYIPVP